MLSESSERAPEKNFAWLADPAQFYSRGFPIPFKSSRLPAKVLPSARQTKRPVLFPSPFSHFHRLIVFHKFLRQLKIAFSAREFLS
jgi:hypothetical protein